MTGECQEFAGKKLDDIQLKDIEKMELKGIMIEKVAMTGCVFQINIFMFHTRNLK